MGIVNQDLYKKTYEVAFNVMQSDNIEKFKLTLPDGSGLYRFVSYRNNDPQVHESGRTIWTQLPDDKNNRWSGSCEGAFTPEHGRQALYLSLPQMGAQDTHFAELEHYQPLSGKIEKEIEVFIYEKNKSPRSEKLDASALRTLFLFTTNQTLSGLNLCLQKNDDKKEEESLPEIIFNELKKKEPSLIAEQDARDLYLAGTDHSFCRALGNACLNAGFLFFQSTSVRDIKEVNIIIGLPLNGSRVITCLDPQGRATFFVDASNTKSKSYTKDDLVYNDLIAPDHKKK